MINLKKKNLKFVKKEEEILKTMCVLDSIFLLIGKSSGFLSIYNILENREILKRQIHQQSITFLIEYKYHKLNFFSCSEDSKIIRWELIYNIYEVKLKKIKTISIHESCVMKLEYLEDNYFASCSMDKSFVIWHLDEPKTNIMKINDSAGIVNFFLDMKKNSNKSFENLMTLNKKKILSFYSNVNEKPFLKQLLIGVDYTNRNSMAKIDDKLFIGTYQYLQIISVKNMQIECRIKIEQPISFLYNLRNYFIVLGFKNGMLKFLYKKIMKILNLADKKDFLKLKNMEESNRTKFEFSSLIHNNEINLFEDEVVLQFNVCNEMLFCISDDTIKIYQKEIEQNKLNSYCESAKILKECFAEFIINLKNYEIEY